MKLEHAGAIKAMTDEQIERSIEVIKQILAEREAGANAKLIEGEAEVVPSLPAPGSGGTKMPKASGQPLQKSLNRSAAISVYLTHSATIRRQSPHRAIAPPLDAAFAIWPLVPGLRTGATPSAFSIRMNRSSISSWMRSVFSWRCATSSSALMLTSYSMSDRTRSFADWRAWLISTKQDKKIASSDTIIVSRPNG